MAAAVAAHQPQWQSRCGRQILYALAPASGGQSPLRVRASLLLDDSVEAPSSYRPSRSRYREWSRPAAQEFREMYALSVATTRDRYSSTARGLEDRSAEQCCRT